ncbi:hypothetical protein M2125_002158, partial [Polynucleobacter sphagniphilus]|uniref:hypothetical protein n=1 Tax=Polynucleobacter sphagniphilus TaxID=1743169 RepID=UPI0024737F5B
MAEEGLGLYKEIPGGLKKGRSTTDDWRKAKDTMYYCVFQASVTTHFRQMTGHFRVSVTTCFRISVTA